MRKCYPYILILLFGIGVPSCCGGFYVIEGVKNVFLSAWNAGESYEPNVPFDVDTVFIHIDYDFVFYSENTFSGTMASSYAFSCDRINNLGNRIESLEITSSSDFGNIPAGESLKPLLFTSEQTTDNLTPVLDVELTSVEPVSSFIIPIKPTTPSHNYTITIKDDSDNEFSFTTENYIWN